MGDSRRSHWQATDDAQLLVRPQSCVHRSGVRTDNALLASDGPPMSTSGW